MLLSKIQFMRLVKESQEKLDFKLKFRWSSEAFILFQKMVEEVTTLKMSKGLLAAAHAKRVTLKPQDIYLVRRIKKDNPHA